MKNFRKAVFPVAGFGTRFLPATKAMPKELLPIVDKPLIQYAAEEAISAGIDTLIFVTGRNKRAIEDHFDNNTELETALREAGKDDQADMVKNILPFGVECIFVRQSEQLGLGHAVLCAERVVGNEPFAVLLADDFVTYEGLASRPIWRKLSNFRKNTVERYGGYSFRYPQIWCSCPGHEPNSVAGLVEKPEADKAPSNLASIGRYILTPDIFDILRNQLPGTGGEIQLADAFNTQAKNHGVEAVMLDGGRFDCGSVQGYLEAVAHCI